MAVEKISIVNDTESNGKFDQNSIVGDTEKGKARRFVRPVNTVSHSICFCSFFVVSLYSPFRIKQYGKARNKKFSIVNDTARANHYAVNDVQQVYT